MTKHNDWVQEFRQKFVKPTVAPEVFRNEFKTVITPQHVENWIEKLLSSELDRQKKELNHDHEILINTIIETKNSELDRAYNEGLGRGYRDSLKDCIDLTDCEECKEHLKVLKTK